MNIFERKKARKAQGLSMNVIVVAAIALLILVILAIIFIGRSGKFASGVSECQGQCVQSGGCTSDAFGGKLVKTTNDPCIDPATGDRDPNQQCCIVVG